MTKSEFWFSMIRPSIVKTSQRPQSGSWEGKLSNPRAAPRARCMNFFSKIYEIPRVAAARAWCTSSVLVNSTVSGYLIIKTVYFRNLACTFESTKFSIEDLNVIPAVFVLLIFTLVADYSQNQTAVSDTLRTFVIWFLTRPGSSNNSSKYFYISKMHQLQVLTSHYGSYNTKPFCYGEFLNLYNGVLANSIFFYDRYHCTKPWLRSDMDPNVPERLLRP
jgi:hypothetical protein